MKLIVAVDKNWGIGKNNDLLFRLPLDMRFFRETTKDKVVVMGYNTLASFPESKPLKNRINVVLTSKKTIDNGCIVANSLDELSAILKNYDSDDVFVIGGAKLYSTMLNYCDEAFVTKVDADGKADVFFPNLDKTDNWQVIKESQVQETNGFNIKFITYKNNSPKGF